MYIISKHKDYYDGVSQTMGIDKTIVFERHQKTLEDSKNFPKPFNNERRRWYDIGPFYELSRFNIDKKHKKKYSDVSPFIIGFCGKLYIGWKFIKKCENGEKNINFDIIYDLNIVKKYIEEKTFFNNIDNVIGEILSYDPINVFREINAPYFVFDSEIDVKTIMNGNNNTVRLNIGKKKFTINPILKEYEFYKVFDSYTAFQEIQMFITGVLGNKEKEIIEIEDKYKIKQHGFNKWSFRKPPSEKK